MTGQEKVLWVVGATSFVSGMMIQFRFAGFLIGIGLEMVLLSLYK